MTRDIYHTRDIYIRHNTNDRLFQRIIYKRIRVQGVCLTKGLLIESGVQPTVYFARHFEIVNLRGTPYTRLCCLCRCAGAFEKP